MKELTHQEAVRLNLAQIHDHAVSSILERHAFELTRCPECLEAEFVHEEGCSLAERVEELCSMIQNAPKARQLGVRTGLPWELGPLVYRS